MTCCIFQCLVVFQKLKLTVLYDVKKICEEVGDSLTEKVTFDKPALELIAEMVWRKVQDYGVDLEHFSKYDHSICLKFRKFLKPDYLSAYFLY